MKVLVVGKGGREHALVWKLAQSPRKPHVYCASGNAGTTLDGENVAIEPGDIDRLVRFAKKESIDLTVVGPEEPLTRGLADAFRKEGLRVFGPTKDAAQLEGSKAFAKQLMRDADVPTAEFRVFDHPTQAKQFVWSRDYVVVDDRTYTAPFKPGSIVEEGGKRYLIVKRPKPGYVPQPGQPRQYSEVRVPLGPPQPLVVKADGLAAGKGVFVCNSSEEAVAAIDQIMVREEFGREAGRKVILEKRLEGQELSVLALVSGRTILSLPSCQDHKRVGDGDTGPNTGGMGAYCPAPLGTPDLLAGVDEKILVPTVHALKRSGVSYLGVLYAGLMVTDKGPRVLEFNCRLGDPETQPVLMRLKTDLLDLLEAAVDGRLDQFDEGKLEWDPRPAVCVVMASKGYPGPYEKGLAISGLDEVARMADVKVFHAGTRRDGDRVLTDGGRVLGVTALGDTLADARNKAYEAAAKIEFFGAHYRRDIGARALPK